MTNKTRNRLIALIPYAVIGAVIGWCAQSAWQAVIATTIGALCLSFQAHWQKKTNYLG